MLKLLRNHVLDQGLFLNSGYFFSKAIFSKILKSDNKELKICHKISAFHLNLHGSDRQNVRKASQLFSNTVGNFLLQFFPEENEGAKFILLIDRLFDLFNSVHETDRRNPNKNSFSGEADQILLLNTSLNEIQNIRVGKTNCSSPSPRKSLLPFQLGFIQSINALKKLYEYISINFEIRYILTYKLTQDSLENFFSQVRSQGHGYNNPTPLEFMYRFRILIFCKNYGSIRFGKNIESEKIEENFVTFEISQMKRIINCKDFWQNFGNIQINSLFYLAGYVSFKCRKSQSCSYTFGGFVNSNSINQSSVSAWITRISKGYLSFFSLCIYLLLRSG